MRKLILTAVSVIALTSAAAADERGSVIETPRAIAPASVSVAATAEGEDAGANTALDGSDAVTVMNARILGGDGGTLGPVRDLMIDENGNVGFVLVEVGGFGVVPYLIAMPIETFDRSYGSNGALTLTTQQTEWELSGLPPFAIGNQDYRLFSEQSGSFEGVAALDAETTGDPI